MRASSPSSLGAADSPLEASTDEGVLTLWSLPFDGDLDSRVANGILGNGGEASIFLHTAAGNIDLIGSGEEAD